MLNNIDIYNKYCYGVAITDEELISLEIFTSENGIKDHHQIKQEMIRRGLEIVERNDWNTKRVGIFINQVKEG